MVIEYFICDVNAEAEEIFEHHACSIEQCFSTFVTPRTGKFFL